MRNAFAAELLACAAADPRVVLLSGDIGNRMFDEFKASFPDRFYNCGVAEANMMGVAAGLALSGLRPVVYTITPFVTTRCLEQIRVDVCYHHAPVIIAGVGGGLSYAELGATHHSCEDIGFLRLLPGMAVVCPGDAVEVRLALKASLAHPDPVYLRLGKKGEPVVHASPPEFVLGRGITVCEGADAAVLSTGNMLPTAVEAAARLGSSGKRITVISMHTVKPLDEELLESVFGSFPVVFTLEEHSVHGGLGGAVAEWLADRRLSGRLVRIGTTDEFLHEAGDQAHARRRFGLDVSSIVERIESQLAPSDIAGSRMPTPRP